MEISCPLLQEKTFLEIYKAISIKSKITLSTYLENVQNGIIISQMPHNTLR